MPESNALSEAPGVLDSCPEYRKARAASFGKGISWSAHVPLTHFTFLSPQLCRWHRWEGCLPNRKSTFFNKPLQLGHVAVDGGFGKPFLTNSLYAFCVLMLSSLPYV